MQKSFCKSLKINSTVENFPLYQYTTVYITVQELLHFTYVYIVSHKYVY